MLLLQGCEFSCSFGDANDKKNYQEETHKSGARIRNEIILEATDLQIEKAYLTFANGEMLPDDNIVDFKQPVKLIIVFENGWNEIEGKSKLGRIRRNCSAGGEVLFR